MSESNKASVARLIEEVWNRGNFVVVRDLVSRDYIGHSSSVETETHGTEGYLQYFSLLRDAFPDIRFTIEDQIAEGDRVATRWTAQGTHQGPFFGIAATGTTSVVSGTTVDRLANGKVAECWTNSDELGLLRQLGLIPTPARAASSSS